MPAVACLLAIFALPSFAAQPVTTTIQQQFNNVFDCGTFQVLNSFTLTITRRTFFDEAGNLLRREAHGTGLGTISNLATGVSYADRATFNRLFDFQGGTVQEAGIQAHINVPGRGVVILEAGKYVFDLATGDILFKTGPATNVEEICAAMQ